MGRLRGPIKDSLSRYSSGRRLLAVRNELRAILPAVANQRSTSERPSGLGMPLNGQLARMRVMRALLNTFSPDAIIETGTFLGDTTRFFAGNLVPVYSVEIKFLYHLLARVRLGRYPDVELIRGDSRTVLETLARSHRFERPLAYLDAHWWDELPLKTEVSKILDAWADSVIVIDDCEVAADPGYGFDAFRGVPLSLELLHLPTSVVCAAPATPSSQETGARRGALYIGQGVGGAGAIRELAEHGYLTLIEPQGISDGV